MIPQWANGDDSLFCSQLGLAAKNQPLFDSVKIVSVAHNQSLW